MGERTDECFRVLGTNQTFEFYNASHLYFYYDLGELGDYTVHSRYSGHPRDRVLVSVKARVRNSGVPENFYFNLIYRGHMCVHFINSSTFFRPVVALKERQKFIYKQNRTGVTYPSCTVVRLST